MFSINSSVNQEREALELTYFDEADVYRNVDVKEGNLNKKQRKLVIENMKCSLSKKYAISSNVKQVNNLEGEYVLFCSKEITKGDEILLTTMNGTKYLLLAGMPHDLISHYEIPVTLQEKGVRLNVK